MYCPGEVWIRQMGYDDGGIALFCGVVGDMPRLPSAAPCGFHRVLGYEATLAEVLAAAAERPEHPPASTLSAEEHGHG
jgi:hypothetical protein